MDKQIRTNPYSSEWQEGWQVMFHIFHTVYSLNCKWDGLAPIINKAESYAYQVKLQNRKMPK